MTRSWADQAACVPHGPGFTELPTTIQLTTCDRCPVRAACLAYAVDSRAVEVVMGGRKIGKSPLVWRADR